MRRLPLPALLILILFSIALPQSGRRTTTPAPAAPVQPPANPEPQIVSRQSAGPLLFLPETLRERYIRSLDNNSFRFSDFSGKVLVINIWASWCGPCRREISEYERVRHDYLVSNVEFIGLTTEDPNVSANRVKKFVRETSFGFLLGWADRETARLLMSGKRGIPQTLVIDRNSNVVDHWAGYAPEASGDRLRSAIDNALR